jgi:hypothetical protein
MALGRARRITGYIHPSLQSIVDQTNQAIRELDRRKPVSEPSVFTDNASRPAAEKYAGRVIYVSGTVGELQYSDGDAWRSILASSISFAMPSITYATTEAIGSGSSTIRSDSVLQFPQALMATSGGTDTLTLTQSGVDLTLTGSNAAGALSVIPAGSMNVSLPSGAYAFTVNGQFSTSAAGFLQVLGDPDTVATGGALIRSIWGAGNLASKTISCWDGAANFLGAITDSTFIAFDQSSASLSANASSNTNNNWYGARHKAFQSGVLTNAAFGLVDNAAVYAIGSRRGSGSWATAITTNAGIIVEPPTTGAAAGGQHGILIRQQTAQQTAAERYGIKVLAQNSGTARWSGWYGDRFYIENPSGQAANVLELSQLNVGATAGAHLLLNDKAGDPTGLVAGQLWRNADNLKFRDASQTNTAAWLEKNQGFTGINTFQRIATALVTQATGGTDEALNNNYEAMKFNSGSATSMGHVSVWLKKAAGTTTGSTVIAELYTNAAGVPGTIVALNGDHATGYSFFPHILSDAAFTETFFYLPATLTASTDYWIVFTNSVAGGNISFDSRAGAAEHAFSANKTAWTTEAKELKYTIQSDTVDPVESTSTNKNGVEGISNNYMGLRGTGQYGFGVYGTSSHHNGVGGNSTYQVGVRGTSTYGIAVNGVSVNSAGGQFQALGSSIGVQGVGNTGAGVNGYSASGDLIQGQNAGGVAFSVAQPGNVSASNAAGSTANVISLSQLNTGATGGAHILFNDKAGDPTGLAAGQFWRNATKLKFYEGTLTHDLNPLTTKGDLVVHNGTTEVREPVGANTFVLTADSTTASGIKWAAGGAGGGDSITVNTVAVVDADFDDDTVAAPAIGATGSNYLNVKWQQDGASPANISAYIGRDAADNPILGFEPTASAVNFISLVNQATGGIPENAAPTIRARGTDANVSLALLPRGTGDVMMGSAADGFPLSFRQQTAPGTPTSPRIVMYGVLSDTVGHINVKNEAGTEFCLTHPLDSTFHIVDDGDVTKKAAFQASGITTGTTRTYTFPNNNGTLLTDNDVDGLTMITYTSTATAAGGNYFTFENADAGVAPRFQSNGTDASVNLDLVAKGASGLVRAGTTFAGVATVARLVGQLGGTFAAPDVRGLRETGTPTLLTYGAVADGQFLQRVGATVVGGVPAGAGGFTHFTKDLGVARRSGTFDITGLAGLTADKVVDIVQTAAQIATKGNARDEAEMDHIDVTGYVVDATTVRAYWQAPSVVVGTYAFAYAVSA